MYDRKTEANEFVGDSVDEARASAARFYGVEESDLKVAVMRETEVAGLQGRAAVVAFPSHVVPGSKPGDEGGGRGGCNGHRDQHVQRRSCELPARSAARAAAVRGYPERRCSWAAAGRSWRPRWGGSSAWA